MATITNTYFNSLKPIELKYYYYKDEPLQAAYIGYNGGIDFYKLNGLNNFQDIAINKGSCFVLTSTVCLSCFFPSPKNFKLGEIPGTLKIQSRSLSSEYIVYTGSNTFTSGPFLSSEATNFFINVKENSDVVEILVNNKYLQVDSDYPYTVRIGDKINDPNFTKRQEFYCDVYNEFITFKTLTNAGYRFLAVGKNNTLEATGVILNDQIVNDYFFKIVRSTSNTLNYNFIPDNNWVTYFLDFPSQVYNRDVSLNKVFYNVETNFLLDFSIEPATKTDTAIFNIANLKTSLSPTGSPPEIDNSYDETIITTN
jgi:hypothetical protein